VLANKGDRSHTDAVTYTPVTATTCAGTKRIVDKSDPIQMRTLRIKKGFPIESYGAR